MTTHPRLTLSIILTALLYTLFRLHQAVPQATAHDLTLLNRIHIHATPALTILAKTFSLLGSPRTLWPTTILIAAILWRRHLRQAATFLLLTMASSGLLETLIKLVVRRPRPAVPWAYIHETSFSFPSGHATLAIALYGTLIYLTRHRPPAQRLTLAAIAVTMTAAIGLSRLYLGAHNPTDVVAGYLTGAICLLAVILGRQICQYRPPG